MKRAYYRPIRMIGFSVLFLMNWSKNLAHLKIKNCKVDKQKEKISKSEGTE